MPDVPRPFKVPLYPFIPLLFVAFCGYLLYSSLSYTSKGALLGAALLIIGFIFYFIFKNKIVARKD